MSNIHTLDIQPKEDVMYPLYMYLSNIKFTKFLLFFCAYFYISSLHIPYYIQLYSNNVLELYNTGECSTSKVSFYFNYSLF